METSFYCSLLILRFAKRFDSRMLTMWARCAYVIISYANILSVIIYLSLNNIQFKKILLLKLNSYENVN